MEKDMKLQVIYNALGGVQIVVNRQYVIEDYNLAGEWIAEAILEKAERDGLQIINREIRNPDIQKISVISRCKPWTKKTARARKLSISFNGHNPKEDLYKFNCLDCGAKIEECECS